MNATMEKFGYPETLIREYDHWVVLLRPQQVTLGALVLICKEDAETLSAASDEAFSELKEVTSVVEAGLKECFAYDKINYLMLMMVDPDVHFHILPRYSAVRVFDQTEFTDSSWPGPPDLGKTNDVSVHLQKKIRQTLKNTFSSVSTKAP